jgi:hypothetical protein
MRSRTLAAAAVATTALAITASAYAEKHTVRIARADQAAAKATAIHLSDFTAGSGWTTAKPSPDDDDVSCASFDPRQADITTTGHASSAFEHPSGLRVESDVEVVRTARMLRLDWQRTVADPRMLPCLREIAAGAAKGTRVRVVSITRVPFPRLAPYLSAYRMRTRVPVNGGSLDVLTDIVVFGTGRVELSLMFTGPYAIRDAITAAEARYVRAMLGRCG